MRNDNGNLPFITIPSNRQSQYGCRKRSNSQSLNSQFASDEHEVENQNENTPFRPDELHIHNSWSHLILKSSWILCWAKQWYTRFYAKISHVSYGIGLSYTEVSENVSRRAFNGNYASITLI